MKLLVSDYDDTLHTSRIHLDLNIRALKRFMKNNMFAISTGRNFVSIKKEIEKYSIPYHYLMCNDGSIIFDEQDTKIFVDYLSEEDVTNLTDYLNINSRVASMFYYGDAKPQEKRKNVIEIEVFAIGENRALAEEISIEFPHIRVVRFPNVMYLKNDISKSDGVRELVTRLNLDPKEVYTVGDNVNDIEMLRDFNGFRMKDSHDLLKETDVPSIDQVHRLIKRISR